MTIVYALVSRGKDVLAEYTATSGKVLGSKEVEFFRLGRAKILLSVI